MIAEFAALFLDGKPLQAILEKIPDAQNFRINYENGDYIAFSARCPRFVQRERGLEVKSMLEIEDIQIQERGSIYSKEGSD